MYLCPVGWLLARKFAISKAFVTLLLLLIIFATFPSLVSCTPTSANGPGASPVEQDVVGTPTELEIRKLAMDYATRLTAARLETGPGPLFLYDEEGTTKFFSTMYHLAYSILTSDTPTLPQPPASKP